jgi:uncharacterized membrane protein YidH (DUF202 family)
VTDPNAVEPGEDEEIFGDARARTDLAWNRSGLALTVATAAVLKVVVDLGAHEAPAVVWFLIGALALGAILALVHGHFVAAPAIAGRKHTNEARLRSVAVATTLFALFALLIASLPDP